MNYSRNYNYRNSVPTNGGYNKGQSTFSGNGGGSYRYARKAPFNEPRKYQNSTNYSGQQSSLLPNELHVSARVDIDEYLY